MDNLEIKRTAIRIESKLYTKLEEIAKKNKRSVNNTIIIAIEQYIAKEKTSQE